MGPSIEVSNMSLSYSGETILKDISHQFAPGKCHVLMGPNGGGKTSLLRSILGLTPFNGDITITWPTEERNIGYVPQKAVFEPSLPLTVMDFVLLNQTRHPLFWRQNQKYKARAMEQLQRVGMAEKAQRRMGQLSGGEQQRVLFAQALLDAPKLIFLDEPTTGMDEQGVQFIEKLISELVAEQRTLVAVLHDASTVLTLPNPLVHIVNRGLLRSGLASELLQADQLSTLYQPNYITKSEVA